MPLRCCAMGRGRRQEDGDERQHQRDAAAAVPRRGRWFDGEQQQKQPSAGWRCRSCAAAAIADCVALGCCPCAIVALLGLALVRAPLAVGRRLRGRRRSLLRRKRVAASSSAGTGTGNAKAASAAAAGPAPPGGAGSIRTLPDAAHHRGGDAIGGVAVHQQMQHADQAEELAWLDEMYRVGHWGFGRVSFSSGLAGKTP